MFYYIMQYFNDTRPLEPKRLKALRVEAKLHGESKVIQRCFDDNNDDDKGDDKKIKDQSKINSSES